MTALAVAADVATAIGRPLVAGAETNRAELLLLLASAEVETETGYKFVPTTYTITRIPDGRKQIVIPAAVASVQAVREINQSDGTSTTLALTTDYTVRGKVIYMQRACEVIEIDFTVSAAVPTEIVKLVAGMVARTLAGPPTGIQSETAGPFTKNYVNNNGDVYLSKSDKLILRPYKQPKPALKLI